MSLPGDVGQAWQPEDFDEGLLVNPLIEEESLDDVIFVEEIIDLTGKVSV